MAKVRYLRKEIGVLSNVNSRNRTLKSHQLLTIQLKNSATKMGFFMADNRSFCCDGRHDAVLFTPQKNRRNGSRQAVQRRLKLLT